MIIRKIVTFPLLCLAIPCAWSQEGAPPLRLAIVGLVHDHVRGILPELAKRHDIQLVGIVETNQGAIDYYAEHFHIDRALVYPTIESLVAKTKGEAVATFTSTVDHRGVAAPVLGGGVRGTPPQPNH